MEPDALCAIGPPGGRLVVGLEITEAMLLAVRKHGCREGVSLVLTDGFTIPPAGECVDFIWCCAVLRYAVSVSRSTYNRIAKEMFRLLKQGGIVANCEMYVDTPHVFSEGFEAAGFKTNAVHVLTRNSVRWERFLQSPRIPLRLIPLLARCVAQIRFGFDSPGRSVSGRRNFVSAKDNPSTTLTR